MEQGDCAMVLSHLLFLLLLGLLLLQFMEGATLFGCCFDRFGDVFQGLMDFKMRFNSNCNRRGHAPLLLGLALLLAI